MNFHMKIFTKNTNESNVTLPLIEKSWEQNSLITKEVRKKYYEKVR